MTTSTLLGYVAGTLTTISFLPQAIKTIKTKDTHGISLIMYLVFTSGIIMWLIYGITIFSLPIIIPNAITLVLSSIILVMKIIHR